MTGNITPITFNYDMYNKISDDLCYLGNNSICRFNLLLYFLNKDNVKISSHSEFMYKDNNQDMVINIKRKLNYFISIEMWSIDDYKDKEYIIIGINDILKLRASLNKVYEWFNDKQYDNLFGKKNGRYVLLKNTEEVIVNNLPQGKGIIFEPIVIEYSDNTIIGIRMMSLNKKYYSDIALDTFQGFKYQIDNINMHETALLMMNYIGRPEYGHNMTTFEDYNFNNTNNNYIRTTKGIIGRTINGGK